MVEYLCSDGLELEDNFVDNAVKLNSINVKHTISGAPDLFVGVLDEIIVKDRHVMMRVVCIANDALSLLEGYLAHTLKVHEVVLDSAHKKILVLPFKNEGHRILSIDFTCDQQNNATLTLKITRAHN